jgi:hypothetical protein
MRCFRFAAFSLRGTQHGFPRCRCRSGSQSGVFSLPACPGDTIRGENVKAPDERGVPPSLAIPDRGFALVCPTPAEVWPDAVLPPHVVAWAITVALYAGRKGQTGQGRHHIYGGPQCTRPNGSGTPGSTIQFRVFDLGTPARTPATGHVRPGGVGGLSNLVSALYG